MGERLDFPSDRSERAAVSAFANDLPVDVLGISAGLCGTLRRWGYGRLGALTRATA